MHEIRWINAEDPLYQQQCALRQRVLFDPIGYSMGLFLRDFPGCEAGLHHVVAVASDPLGPRVVGCASLLPPSSAGKPGEAKLMQMAVDPDGQGRGIGRSLVTAVEQAAFADQAATTLYCHARDLAYGFYQRLGWTFDSEPFWEVGIEHRRLVTTRPSLNFTG